jgi:hypothetical protein
MSNATVTPEQVRAALAVLAVWAEGQIEQPTTPVVTQPKAEPKADGRNHEARKHNFERRQARRSATKLGGLTKAERSALYAANPQLAKMSATARKAAWAKIVAAHKAA